jgi:cytidine deaminase
VDRTGIEEFDELRLAAMRLVAPISVAAGEGEIGVVAAALETSSGDVFTGVSVHLPCGLGFCAEVNALGQMLSAQQRVVRRIVAVDVRGVLTPCGRCRETLAQIDATNLTTAVMVSADRVVPLSELLPCQWQAEAGTRT